MTFEFESEDGEEEFDYLDLSPNDLEDAAFEDFPPAGLIELTDAYTDAIEEMADALAPLAEAMYSPRELGDDDDV